MKADKKIGQKVNKNDMLLYVVTDRAWLNGNSLVKQVEQTINAGATFIQLREKNLGYDEFVDLARQIKVVTDRYQIPFVINDNVDVAAAVDADGVHLGQSDDELLEARARLGNDKIIGISAQTVEDALKAERNGADYLGVGAVFNTSTKLDAETVSFDDLKKICRAVTIPIVAIGGINQGNILELSGSGIDGVAVVSAIFAQPDIEKATGELLALTKEMVQK